MNIKRASYIRKQAIIVFELTKGFTTKTEDNALKTAFEMAGYVMELTDNLDDDKLKGANNYAK